MTIQTTVTPQSNTRTTSMFPIGDVRGVNLQFEARDQDKYQFRPPENGVVSKVNSIVNHPHPSPIRQDDRLLRHLEYGRREYTHSHLAQQNQSLSLIPIKFVQQIQSLHQISPIPFVRSLEADVSNSLTSFVQGSEPFPLQLEPSFKTPEPLVSQQEPSFSTFGPLPSHVTTSTLFQPPPPTISPPNENPFWRNRFNSLKKKRKFHPFETEPSSSRPAPKQSKASSSSLEPNLQISDMVSVVSDFQKHAYKKVTSKGLTRDELQQTIRDLFISMAEEISPSDNDAILLLKTAVDLVTPDEDKMARLLMVLGDAYMNKNDIDSIEQAIKYYDIGAHLKKISNNQRAAFYLKTGKAYLIGKQADAENKAIHFFSKGINASPETDLLRELTSSIGKAFCQMAENIKLVSPTTVI